jgi:hypothetical protein
MENDLRKLNVKIWRQKRNKRKNKHQSYGRPRFLEKLQLRRIFRSVDIFVAKTLLTSNSEFLPRVHGAIYRHIYAPFLYLKIITKTKIITRLTQLSTLCTYYKFIISLLVKNLKNCCFLIQHHVVKVYGKRRYRFSILNLGTIWS